MRYENILKKLNSLSNSKAVEGMAKYGITPEKAYGVSILNLRKIISYFCLTSTSSYSTSDSPYFDLYFDFPPFTL